MSHEPSDLDRLFAPLSTVERYHTEDKAWKEAHMQFHAQQGERLVRIESAREAIDKRLADGGEAFSELRDSIIELRKEIKASEPKPMTRWQILGFILGPLLGVVMVVGSIIWQAARTPSRDEFTKLQEQVEELQVEQAKMSASMDALVHGLTRSIP